jgi:hypothetical protein
MSASTLPHSAHRLLIVAIVTIALLATLFAALPADLDAAAVSTPPAQEIVIPMAPADEGGDGLSGSTSSEWIPFAVLLGPFLVVITGLLWLTFRIDASEADDE